MYCNKFSLGTYNSVVVRYWSETLISWSCDETDLRPIKTGLGLGDLQDTDLTFYLWTYNKSRAAELMLLCNLTPADNTTFVYGTVYISEFVFRSILIVSY